MTGAGDGLRAWRERLSAAAPVLTAVCAVGFAVVHGFGERQGETGLQASGRYSADYLEGPRANLMSWNIQYGQAFEDVVEAIANHDPQILLLQEVDSNTDRTGRREVAEDLALRLGMDYAFGVEFEELSQGSGSPPAFTGQATLARFPLRSSRVLRFTSQSSFWAPRWYLPNWKFFQRRRGGRMALVPELGAGDRLLVTYNVHLESRGPDTLRMQQLEEIVEDAGGYPAGTCIVLAGDFNSRNRPAAVVARLGRAGFLEAGGGRLTPTSPRGGALDLIFYRGPLQADDRQVHAGTGASDHFPVTARLSVAECSDPFAQRPN